MNILAIDSSSASGSVAVAKNGQIKALMYLNIEVTHSERLLPLIDTCLKRSKLQQQDLDAVVISIGPGSFTGLRIGLATAKGICLGLGIPLISFSSLKMLAANMYGAQYPLLTVMDARMGELYAAMYTSDLQELIAPHNCLPQQSVKLIEQPVIIIGDGYPKHKQLFDTANVSLHFALPHQNLPTAAALVSLAMQNPVPSFDEDAIAKLEPEYLRRSQAELNAAKH